MSGSREAEGAAAHDWAEVYWPLTGWEDASPTNAAIVGLTSSRLSCTAAR